MKVTTKFSPVTIVLESPKDVADLEIILRLAALHSISHTGSTNDTYEHCYFLLRALIK